MPVYLAVVLGSRRGEVLGLSWEQIDFENKVVRIIDNYTMAQGKPILLDDPKSSDSNLDIIVTDRIISLLKEHRKNQLERMMRMGSKYNKSNFVYTWPDGKLFNPSHLSQAYKLKMVKYGLPEITYHELRHSNGTLMISNNVHMKSASERLSHSTIVVTNDLYRHVEMDVQKLIAETIDKAIWGE